MYIFCFKRVNVLLNFHSQFHSSIAMFHIFVICFNGRLCIIICFIFSELKNPQHTLEGMLKYKSLPQHIEAVFIQNILKIFAYLMQCYEVDQEYNEILYLCDVINEKLNESLKSGELEVQERASTTSVILKIVHEEISASE